MDPVRLMIALCIHFNTMSALCLKWPKNEQIVNMWHREPNKNSRFNWNGIPFHVFLAKAVNSDLLEHFFLV